MKCRLRGNRRLSGWNWQADMKCGPLSRYTGRPYRSMHRLHQVFDDRKAKTRATQLPRASPVNAIEALKNARQIALRDANARVFHLQAGVPILGIPADADAALLGRVFEGVVDEIVENLGDRLLI